jgi:apolipoprotein N-acyltransferase
MKKHFAQQQAESADRLGYLWLMLGLLCWLFAANGVRDIAVAAWLAPLFLLRFTRTRSPLRGCVGIGLAALIVTISWQVESKFYDPQHLLSVVNLLVLAILLSAHLLLVVPYLLDRLLAPRLGLKSRLLATLIFPLGLVVCEYLSTHFVPYGFFFSAAYTQYGDLPLIQLVSLTGTYGLSFLIAWFASVSALVWELRFSWPRIRSSVLLYGGVLVFVLLFGGARLAFSAPSTQTVRVAGVSASRTTYERATKLQGSGDRAPVRAAYTATTNELLDASSREARAGTRIIVWPELATYTFPEDEAKLIERGQALAHTQHIYLEIAYGVDGPQGLLRDRAVLIDQDGHVLWTYDKAHPGMSLPTVSDGPGIVPIANTPYGRLAGVICVDAWYPDLMQQVRNRGVDLMLVPGQEWPGIYLWTPQETSFRAIEYGYALVRPAGWDVGMIFDAQGRVLATSDYYTTNQQIMVAYVPTKGTWTVYGLVGDLFTWLCMGSLFALIALAVIRAWRKPKRAEIPTAPLSVGKAEERYKAGTL